MNSQADRSPQSRDDQIGVREIVGLLTDNWKWIAGMCMLGLLVSGVSVAVIAPEFEASALVEMATAPGKQVGQIEEPAALVERLKQPTTYTAEVIKACGVQGSASSGEELAKRIKATRITFSLVEMRIRREGHDLAKECIKSVFLLIKQQQAALAKPQEEQSRSSLALLRSQFLETQASTPRDEQINWLVERLYLANRIYELEQSLLSVHETRLVAPIYATTQPVYPKRVLTLVLGAIVGLMIGLLLAMAGTALGR